MSFLDKVIAKLISKVDLSYTENEKVDNLQDKMLSMNNRLKGDSTMENKKWYVVRQSAEDCTYGVVALTDDELAGAKKMLDYKVVVEGDWSGSFSIDDTPYETEEQARNAVLAM